MTPRVVLVALLVTGPFASTEAQRRHDAGVAPGAPPVSGPLLGGTALHESPTAGLARARPAGGPGPMLDSASGATPWSVLASALIPGTGQALLRQDRLIAYLAIEAFAWARYRVDVREGQRARAAYRRLAAEVARRPFSIARPVGDFEYYERMEKFVESGAFDAIDGGALEPEPDTTTANGSIWLLARQTFWADPNVPPPTDSPEYSRAEAFYRERAVRPEYRWSWANAHLEYAEFRRTIRRSNNAYRTSLQDLGLVIANHALSTVDAFITVRLRRQGASGTSERFELFGSVPIGGH